LFKRFRAYRLDWKAAVKKGAIRGNANILPTLG